MKKELLDLVTTEWLQNELENPDIRIVDCRWFLNQPGRGLKDYHEGHIPGAVHLDVDQHLSEKEGPGRHPLPLRKNFEKTISAVGIRRDHHVIAYDEGKGVPAPRLWWLLRYRGHEKVSLLDGGWTLWIQEGRPVTKEAPSFPAANFTARPKRKWVVNKEEVDALREDPAVLLIDARSPERYRGEEEPIDPRPGHIPGAQNFPYTDTIDLQTGRFHSPERLRTEFEKMDLKGVKTIICYCGSGVTACTDLLALKLAGLDKRIDLKLYEGSWSDWSRDKSLPAKKI